MTLLLMSVSADARTRTVLHAVATVSSQLPMSWGLEERSLVSSGSTCLAEKKKEKEHRVYLLLQKEGHQVNISYFCLPREVRKLLV